MVRQILMSDINFMLKRSKTLPIIFSIASEYKNPEKCKEIGLNHRGKFVVTKNGNKVLTTASKLKALNMYNSIWISF